MDYDNINVIVEEAIADFYRNNYSSPKFLVLSEYPYVALKQKTFLMTRLFTKELFENYDPAPDIERYRNLIVIHLQRRDKDIVEVG